MMVDAVMVVITTVWHIGDDDDSVEDGVGDDGVGP